MTTERQKAANRANARRSTGPRTAAGKARSSRNATRHGLTSRPLGEAILDWYRIIAGDAEADPVEAELRPLQQSALRLAAAEARLAHIRQMQEEHLLGPDMDSDYAKGAADFGALVAEAMAELSEQSKEWHDLIKAADRFHRRNMARDAKNLELQGRLLRRYLSSAEKRREAALREWIDKMESEKQNKPNFNYKL